VQRTGPATIEFGADGKIKTSDKLEGIYDVDGDALMVMLGDAGAEDGWKAGLDGLVFSDQQARGAKDWLEKFRIKRYVCEVK